MDKQSFEKAIVFDNYNLAVRGNFTDFVNDKLFNDSGFRTGNLMVPYLIMCTTVIGIKVINSYFTKQIIK